MTLNELRYVVAVAKERNFRRAAKNCFISQPALSVAIQKLEDELDIKIFERSKTVIALTNIGGLVVEQAQHVLEEADKIKTLACTGNNPLIGPIRLGVIFTVGPYLLPKIIPELKKLAPDMPLNIEEGLTANIEQHLRNGYLDAAILALPFDVPGIKTDPLYDEVFKVVVSSTHPWAQMKSLHSSALEKEKVLLLDSGHCFSNQVTEFCPELSRYSQDTVQGNSLETIRNMVASGLGVTVMPACATNPYPGDKLLQVVSFKSPEPSRRIALVWRKSFNRQGAIDVIKQAIINVKATWMQKIQY
jgi:LysR family transcriptional regulator, hydrogen peroxide-inducible genes activator